MQEISISERANQIAKIADKNFLSSSLLKREEYYNAAVNRLYYAVFQQALQFFLRRQIIPPTEKRGIHGKVKGELIKYLRKNGGAEGRALHQSYNDLLQARELCDYEGQEIKDETEYNQIANPGGNLYSSLKNLFQ